MTTTAPPETTAPARRSRAARWARRNLFRTPLDSIITIVFGSIAVFSIFRGILFVFVNARWEIIDTNLKLLLVGRWPADELIRIAVAVVVFAVWAGVIAGLIVGRRTRRGNSDVTEMAVGERAMDLSRRFGLIIVTVLLLLSLTDTSGPWVMALLALVGGVAGRIIGGRIGILTFSVGSTRIGLVVLAAIPVAVYLYLTAAVPLEDWEGFLFNITAAVAGIVLSFPLGVLLALGRRSKLPLLKVVSIGYIEFVRGSPLFVLLLLANVSLEFFIPQSLAPSKVIRAIVTFTIFTAAYVAEIVRGGLQSVPQGQEEAAKAVGLSPAKQMRLIVLPQALRNVIPAQIGQFIALFKDTTLAGLALGILELLSGAGAITQQEAFRGQGLIIETLVFVAFLFWVGSFTMSRESQRLERKLGVGTR